MCSRGSWIRRLSQNCPPLHVGSPGRRRPPTRQSPALPLSSFPAQVTRAYTGTRAHKQGHTRTRGHMNTRRDKGTGVNERARANKSARAPVHTCTPALRLGYAGTHKQTRTPTQKCPHPVPAPGAPASPLPAPRPLLQRPSPVSGLPLTWRRCRRTRAPRAHPPGGPGVGARSRMAALAPAESRAGRGRPRPARTALRRRCQAGMPPEPLRLGVRKSSTPGAPERSGRQLQVHSAVRSQMPGTKARRVSARSPGAPPSDTN